MYMHIPHAILDIKLFPQLVPRPCVLQCLLVHTCWCIDKNYHQTVVQNQTLLTFEDNHGSDVKGKTEPGSFAAVGSDISKLDLT